MHTRSKEKPDKVIKYAEVNSDVDLDSEEEKLNAEFKRLSVKTKKAGKGTSPPLLQPNERTD
jgi:hypothetical protein